MLNMCSKGAGLSVCLRSEMGGFGKHSHAVEASVSQQRYSSIDETAIQRGSSLLFANTSCQSARRDVPGNIVRSPRLKNIDHVTHHSSQT